MRVILIINTEKTFIRNVLFDRQKNGKKKKIEWIILNKILELRKIQGKSRKFIGALTTELIRTELLKQRFNVSNSDVFIEGIPNELDLLIVKADKNLKEKIFYSPDDILVVFEIKFRGAYGEKQKNSIKRIFDNVKRKNENIECIINTIFIKIFFGFKFAGVGIVALDALDRKILHIGQIGFFSPL